MLNLKIFDFYGKICQNIEFLLSKFWFNGQHVPDLFGSTLPCEIDLVICIIKPCDQ